MKNQNFLDDVRACNAQDEASPDPQKPLSSGSQATDLVSLVDDLPLFHCDDTPYVDLEINEHRETLDSGPSGSAIT